MAARGTVAKDKITKKILDIFGKDAFVYDKKLYIWSEENGEKVQVALTLTCPKVPAGEVVAVDRSQAPSMSDMLEFGAQEHRESVQQQITTDERENIKKLMESLGL